MQLTKSSSAQVSYRHIAASMHRYPPLYLGLFHQQENRDDGEKDDAEHLEIVEEGKHGGLPLHNAVDHALSPVYGARTGRPSSHEAASKVDERFVIGGAEEIYVLHEMSGVELRAALEHGGDRGDAHAGSDVASQIDDAGAHVGLFSRHRSKRGDVDGDEQEGQAESLHHPSKHGVAEIEPQAPASHHEKRGCGYGAAEGDEVARVHARYKVADEGHGEHDERPAGRKREPCQLRRVSHEFLKHQGNQHGAGVQNESQEEHGDRSNREIPVFQHTEIHHRILRAELPQNTGNHTDDHEQQEKLDETGR